jgi:hypothetical protein
VGPKPIKPLRLADCLRSHARGAVLELSHSVGGSRRGELDYIVERFSPASPA